MARASATKKKAQPVAVRKPYKSEPRKIDENINALYRTTKSLKSARSAATKAGGKANSGVGGNANHDTNSNDDQGWEFYPDNDANDGNYMSTDGDSGSDSEDWSAVSDNEDGTGDEDESPFDSGYGNLEEIGGTYKVLMEVTVEKHEERCGCDLDAKDLIHRRVSAEETDDESAS